MIPIKPQIVYIPVSASKEFYVRTDYEDGEMRSISPVEKKELICLSKEELIDLLEDFQKYDHSNPTVKTGLPLNNDWEKISEWVEDKIEKNKE